MAVSILILLAVAVSICVLAARDYLASRADSASLFQDHGLADRQVEGEFGEVAERILLSFYMMDAPRSEGETDGGALTALLLTREGAWLRPETAEGERNGEDLSVVDFEGIGEGPLRTEKDVALLKDVILSAMLGDPLLHVVSCSAEENGGWTLRIQRRDMSEADYAEPSITTDSKE